MGNPDAIRVMYEQQLTRCLNTVRRGITGVGEEGKRLSRYDRVLCLMGGTRGLHLNLKVIRQEQIAVSPKLIKKANHMTDMFLPLSRMYHRSLEIRHRGLRFLW